MLVCAAMLGCSGATWRTLDVESGYQPPKVVTVTVISTSVTRDPAKALAIALVEELQSHRIRATVIEETRGTADTTVTIGKWDPGSQGLRWLFFLASGKGEISVSVSGTVGVAGMADGWVKGGWFGGESNNAAIAAGELIGRTIAQGRPPEVTPRPPPSIRVLRTRYAITE